jgi:hypothetical protein
VRQTEVRLKWHALHLQAEGGRGDIAQLDALLRALGFTQSKADDQVLYSTLRCYVERVRVTLIMPLQPWGLLVLGPKPSA